MVATPYVGADGRHYLRVVAADAKPIDRRMPHTDYAYVPEAKGFRQVDQIPVTQAPSRPEREVDTVLTPVLKVELESLYVSGDKGSEFSRAIVAGDASDGGFSHEGNFVQYRHGGHVFVRELRPLTPEDLDRLRAQEEAKRLLSQVKQVGVGLAIYLADHDDVFPGRNDKVGDLISPYLQDGKVMPGFVYTFAGGSATAIAEPTQTVLGYIQGKYGRAIVYADTSAKWEPRKP